MKILILSFYYQPDLCAGSFRCSALVRQLKNLAPDLEIEIITTLPNRYTSFHPDAAEIEVQPGCTVRRVKLPNHQSGMVDQAKAFAIYARHVMQLTRTSSYDVVFATSSRLMTATLGAWIARRKNAKLYLDIRDIFVETLADVLPKRLAFFLQPVFSSLERLSLKNASRVNLVSLGFQSYFAEKYPAANLCFYTNGIDEEFMNVAIDSTKIVPPSYPLTVLYAGNIGEGQGLHVILPELGKKLAGRVHFKVLGDGGRKNQLKEALKQANCTNVELLPPVDRVSLLHAYHDADVLFLHLNDYDAFKRVLPSKLFEYAALGKPIWAGVAGYSAEFIHAEISNAATFAPGDSLAAEQALNNLVIATQPRESFLQNYSRQKIMQEMATDILSLF